MNLVYGSIGTYESVRPNDAQAVTGAIYVHGPTQHLYGVARIGGAVAIVDDHQDDRDATDWWIDPGLVTDDIPPKVQAEPKSSCAWRRRADHT